MNEFWDQPSLENALPPSRLLQIHNRLRHRSRGAGSLQYVPPNNDSLHQAPKTRQYSAPCLVKRILFAEKLYPCLHTQAGQQG